MRLLAFGLDLVYTLVVNLEQDFNFVNNNLFQDRSVFDPAQRNYLLPLLLLLCSLRHFDSLVVVAEIIVVASGCHNAPQ